MLKNKALLLRYFPTKIKAWLVCLSAALFYFCQNFQATMLNSLNVPIVKTFSITAPEIGTISTAYYYANILFLCIAGIMADQISRRKLLVIACTVNVLSIAGFAFANAPWQLFVCHFIIGLVGTFSLVGCMSLALHWFPKKFLASIVSLMVGIGGAAAIVAQTPLISMIESLGWRRAICLFVLFELIILVLMIVFVQDAPRLIKTTKKQQKKRIFKIYVKKFKIVSKNIQNWLVGFYMAFINTSTFVLGGLWGNLYLVQMHGLKPSMASLIISVMFIGGVMGNISIGFISDYLQKRKLLLQIGSALSISAAVLILIDPFESIFALFCVFFVIGLSTGPVALSYVVIAEKNAPTTRSSAQGFGSTLLMIGGIFQYVFAQLVEFNWDHTIQGGVPIYSEQGFRLALLIIPICALVSLTLSFFIKEKTNK